MKPTSFFTLRKWLFCLSMVVCFSGSPHAQTAIRGQVTDAGNGQPVEAATVLLSCGNRPDPVAYTLTGSDGMFTLPAAGPPDSLVVTVSLLGYRAQSQPASTGRTMQFRLAMEAINLKEVEVRPGRVWGRQDTINYKVDGFLTARDRSIQDVLKKMPGIDIDENGKIAYNGKEISHLYVEGLDLTNGKYAQISRNLQAQAVDKVQVLENHQPIRVLRKKIKTEDVALNLQLKPDFRSRWMGSLEGSAGLSPWLRGGAADAFQIGRKSQSAYLYKGNNYGEDVAEEQALLGRSGAGEEPEPEIGAFLAPYVFDTPLKKRRLLFNDSHSLAGNRLYKTGETSRLRLNTGYTRQQRSEQRGSETIYYQQTDSLRISEQRDTRLRQHQASLGIQFEDNAADHFLTELCELNGDWQTTESEIQTGASAGEVTAVELVPSTGPRQTRQSAQQPNPPHIQEQIRTPGLRVGNSLHSLWNRERYAFEIRSRLRYSQRADRLRIDYPQASGASEQYLPYRSFYTDNTLALLRTRGKLTGRYETRFSAETGPAGNRYSLSFTPYYQWNARYWQVFASLPLAWTKVSGTNCSRFAPNPSLTLIWQPTYAWRFSAYATYQESYGSLTSLYGTPYRTDYRHTILPGGVLPVRQRQLYSIYGHYKHTVRELFATFNLTYVRDRNNLAEEQLFEGEQQTTASRPAPRLTEGWTLKSVFSKGIYDWKMKTSLTLSAYSGRDAAWSEGSLLPLRNRYVGFAPKISWSPWPRMEASYEAAFRYGGSTIGRRGSGTTTRLTPLWHIEQQAQIRYDFFPFAISLTADHYHNDLDGGQAAGIWLADATVNWKNERWEVSLAATNLCDKKEYRYTQYTALQQSTSWLRIRPRAFLLTAGYRF